MLGTAGENQVMNILLILTSGIIFLLAVLILGKKSKKRGDYILFYWLLITLLETLSFYWRYEGQIEDHSLFIGLSSSFPLLHASLLFLYVLDLVGRFPQPGTKSLLLFIPFGIYLLLFLGARIYLDMKGRPEELVGDFNQIFGVIVILALLIVAWYLLRSARIMVRYVQYHNNHFSFPQHKAIDWTRTLVVGYTVIWLSMITVSISDHLASGSTNMMALQTISFGTFALFMIGMGYFGLINTGIFSNAQWIFTPNQEGKLTFNRYAKSGLDMDKAQEFARQLIHYTEQHQPYLNPQLSLRDLSDALQISENHLSQVINEQLGLRFFDFINQYRVEEFKKRIKRSQHQKYTLLAVAQDCGFNSKSAFHATFKKCTGTTPSKFIESLEHNPPLVNSPIG
ncbi:MAG: AraC family transcriptional regulator [Bacteroidetes bacterium]|nr:AraC family transcriptional regulator [Bacteroidota bacterium]